ncbi:MAG: hypothetical protein ACRBFS_12265 [Aureispira sp.]
MSDLLDDHFGKYKEPIVPSHLAKFKGKIPYLILDADSIGELCPLFEEAGLDYALQRQEQLAEGISIAHLNSEQLNQLEVLVHIKEEEKEQADQLVAAYEKQKAAAEALFQEKILPPTPLSKLKEGLMWIVVVVLSMLFTLMMLGSM